MVLEYYINKPLISWSIIVTELEFDENPGRRRLFGSAEFQTLEELHAYFMSTKKYEIGEKLKYNIKRKPQPKQYPIPLTGRLTFTYTDRWVTQQFEFDEMGQFIAFLVERPLLAKAVGYAQKWAILKGRM